MLLEYFGEQFPETDCQKSCNNCALRARLKTGPVLRDYGALAAEVMEALEKTDRVFTMNQLIDALKGRGSKRFGSCAIFSRGKSVPESILRQILLSLLEKGFLSEKSHSNKFNSKVKRVY